MHSRLVLRVVFSVCRALIPPPLVRVSERGTVVGREVSQGLRLEDPRLSRHHATFYAASDGRLSVVDQNSKNGTFVNGVRVARHQLAEGDVVSLGDSCVVIAREPEEEHGPIVPGLLGDSAAMRLARAAVRKLGPTNLTVLLTAETGCGKEVVTRALHAASGLKGAFVAINCAAIPENLFESELFGHTAKAFTNAVAHTGFFREALGGTLLLDEVGELPLPLQPKLLRVLEERAVVPLGATRPIPCPVRVVAATNRDLTAAVARGEFRRDLFARLFEATIPLPPLRERREDVLMLFASALGVDDVTMTHSLADAMLRHEWPSNVRELVASAREVSADFSSKKNLDISSFRNRLAAVSSPIEARASEPPSSPERDARALSSEELTAMLAVAGGTVAKVARAAGRSRRQVYRWIQKYGIRIEDFRS